MSYPDLDIRNLTVDKARAIYRRDFWDRAKADQYHGAIAYQLFDMAINHGNGNAIRMLQRAVGVADDGSVGNLTLAAIKDADLNDTLMRLNGERLDFITKLFTWPDYGEGWTRRVAGNLRYAAQDN